MSENPERLLAEALRAQARNAPPPHQPGAPPGQAAPSGQVTSPAPAAAPTGAATSGTGSADDSGAATDLAGGYGLLSGAAHDPFPLRRAASDLGTALPSPGPTRHRLSPEPLPARWVLMLAVSLGLATGSVLGLLTL